MGQVKTRILALPVLEILQRDGREKDGQREKQKLEERKGGDSSRMEVEALVIKCGPDILSPWLCSVVWKPVTSHLVDMQGRSYQEAGVTGAIVEAAATWTRVKHLVQS